MKEQRCKHCDQTIPTHAVQQGGCHMWCYSDWFNTELPAWKVEHEGSFYIETDLRQVQDMLSDMDDGGHYTITRVKIKRGEYERLPEFTGF